MRHSITVSRISNQVVTSTHVSRPCHDLHFPAWVEAELLCDAIMVAISYLRAGCWKLCSAFESPVDLRQTIANATETGSMIPSKRAHVARVSGEIYSRALALAFLRLLEA